MPFFAHQNLQKLFVNFINSIKPIAYFLSPFQEAMATTGRRSRRWRSNSTEAVDYDVRVRSVSFVSIDAALFCYLPSLL